MYTLTHLINALCFFGRPLVYTQTVTNIFLIGSKEVNFLRFSIIALVYTRANLNQFLNIVMSTVQTYGHIWCCGFTQNVTKTIWKKIQKLQQSCWYTPQLVTFPGFLTNFKIASKFVSDYKLPGKQLIRFPQLVYYTNYTYYYQFKEALKLGIPTGIIADSDAKKLGHFYWIPGNTSTEKSLYFYSISILTFIIQSKYQRRVFFVNKVLHYILTLSKMKLPKH